jgi:ubiquinone/menaquinone biosynthesis C-methylase UbiE
MWYAQDAGIICRGSCVLDVACGRGRHPIAAAERRSWPSKATGTGWHQCRRKPGDSTSSGFAPTWRFFQSQADCLMLS